MRVVNIIPTYNEKDNIGKMLTALEKIAIKHKRYDFCHLVVDDKSPDGTAVIVKKRQEKNKNVYLLSGNRVGLGEALFRGYDYAISKLNADVVIPNDCDFSFNPKHIPELLKKIDEGYDIVIASRHVGDGTSEGWTLFRRLNHFVANEFFAWHVAGVKEAHDHNGNFKAVRVKKVLDQINFKKIKVKGFGFQVYLYYELSKLTSKFFEIPVTFVFRTIGESKVSFNPKYFKTYIRDVLEYIKLCIAIRLERWKLLRF
jgi:dolichol-phosphate mannosyltransferase